MALYDPLGRILVAGATEERAPVELPHRRRVTLAGHVGHQIGTIEHCVMHRRYRVRRNGQQAGAILGQRRRQRCNARVLVLGLRLAFARLRPPASRRGGRLGRRRVGYQVGRDAIRFPVVIAELQAVQDAAGRQRVLHPVFGFRERMQQLAAVVASLCLAVLHRTAEQAAGNDGIVAALDVVVLHARLQRPPAFRPGACPLVDVPVDRRRLGVLARKRRQVVVAVDQGVRVGRAGQLRAELVQGEERGDDAGGVGRQLAREAVAIDLDAQAAVMLRGHVEATVREGVEVPETAVVGSAKAAHPAEYQGLAAQHAQHRGAEVRRQKPQAIRLGDAGGNDRGGDLNISHRTFSGS